MDRINAEIILAQARYSAAVKDVGFQGLAVKKIQDKLATQNKVLIELQTQMLRAKHDLNALQTTYNLLTEN